MLLEPEKVTKITLSCALLHNFLRRSKTSSSEYSPNGYQFDIENEDGQIPGTWRQEQIACHHYYPFATYSEDPERKLK